MGEIAHLWGLIEIKFNFVSESFSLQCYIEVLLLDIPFLSSKYSCQTLQIYIPKSKTKIHTRPFLLVILMAAHSSGGLMATQLWTVGKLKILQVHKTFLNWLQHLNIYQDPNWQVKTFTNIFFKYYGKFYSKCDKENYSP